jgi:hypothetical protein
MKTYFIEIVFNNVDQTARYCRFPGGIVAAKSLEEAKQIVLDHYKPYYTAGDKGTFKVQCAWEVSVPTREIIEKHWKKASGAQMTMDVRDNSGTVIGYRYYHPDKTKKDVMENWDFCHCNWASPVVYFDPKKSGYVVAIHNFMCMPNELMLFKGNTATVYKKAKQWVKDNTFKGNHFRNIKLI